MSMSSSADNSADPTDPNSADAPGAPNSADAPGTAPAPRKRCRKKEGKKPGKVSWVHGTKLVFFKAHAKDWQSAKDMGESAVSTFYDRITNLYLLKYGYDMKDEEDLDVDVDDPIDPDAKHPDARNISQEEADRRTKINAQVRGRIGFWYRQHYGTGGNKKDANIFKELLTSGVEMGAVRPVKAQLVHYYSRAYYTTRVKAAYDKKWAEVVEDAKKNGVDPPADVKVRAAVTKSTWNAEPAAFKEQVRLAMEKDHAAEVRAWEIARAEEPSRSKEELSAALKSAGFYLQPLADAIQERFGMNVAIMLCGPVGDRGGAIEARSVHAGMTRGVNPKKWHQFDRVGYQEAERSMVRFTERCFTADQCQERIVESAEPEPGAQSSTLDAASASAPSTMSAAITTPATTTTPTTPATMGPAPSAPAITTPTAPITTMDDGDSELFPDELAPNKPTQGGLDGDGGDGGGDQGGLDEDRGDGDGEGPAAWRREDMRKWPEELRRAHAAFRLGEKWESDWAECVNTYLDFEAACGYEDGPRIGGEHRPEEVAEWIRGGRKWFSTPNIRNLGRLGEKGSYADNWWLWWRSIQPPERDWIVGMLTTPTDVTWGKLDKMSGKNGFMQVMASLLWWGMHEVRRGQLGIESGWSRAKTEVRWVLGELIESRKMRDAQTPPPIKSKSKRKRADDEEDNGGRSKRTRAGKEKEVSPRRTRSDKSRPRPRPIPKAKK